MLMSFRFGGLRVLLSAMVVAVVSLPIGATQSKPQEVALQAAIRTETIDGNPRAAAVQFKSIIDTYKEDRATVAIALVHLGDCYRKLGEAAASDMYATVVRDYKDQPDAVLLARTRLDAGETGPAPVRQVWTLPDASNAAGRVAWNGRVLPYVDWSDEGAANLFIRDLVTGATRRLTATGNPPGGSWDVFAGDAAVSRDGDQIAYEWFDGERFGLRILRLQTPGAPPRALELDAGIRVVRPRDWTPDGRAIAALWRKTDSSIAIGMVSVADGSLRLLAPIDRGCICDVSMALSPDGRHLAFGMAGVDTVTRDIYVVPTAGGAVLPAVAYTGDDALVGWSPDGQSIVFKSGRTGAPGLWAVGFSDGRVGSATPLKLELGAFSPLGITSSGAIYGCRCEPQAGSNIEIATFDFSTGRFLSPPVDAVQEYVGTNTQPFWSNDGRFFLYRSVRPQQDPILVIRAADTLAVVRELRPKFATISDPRWSPDDLSIGLIGNTFDGKFGYFKMDARTGQTAPIILYPRGSGPVGPMGPESSWSPDGRKFYFRRYPHGADSEFVEADVVTGAARVVVRAPEGDKIPATISPDGGTLYYLREAGAQPAVLARDLATGNERELFRRAGIASINRSWDGAWLGLTVNETSAGPAAIVLVPTGGGDAREAWRAGPGQQIGSAQLLALGAGTWAPDGRSILTRTAAAGGAAPELWWLPLDGRAPRRLDELAGMIPAGLRLHPDGQRVLFAARTANADEKTERLTEVWVWENLLAPAARR